MSDAPSSPSAADDRVRATTEHLVLREIEIEDAEAIHEYASDAEVVALLRWGPNTREQTEAWVRAVIAERAESPRYVHTLGVCEIGEDRVIGSCRLEQPVRSEKSARISFVLNKAFWRRGYMAEAATGMVRFGFEKLGLNWIVGTTPVENWGSGLVLEKAGLHKQALLDGHLLGRDGRWVDANVYSAFRNTWPDKPTRPSIKPSSPP